MNAPTLILMDVDQHAGLPFPRSLREFQRLFPGDAACAEYLEKVRWGDGFVCPHCGVTGEPVSNLDPPWCAGMPQLSTSDRIDCRHGHGAQSHAIVHLVLGCLPGRQPNSGHVGRQSMAFPRPA